VSEALTKATGASLAAWRPQEERRLPAPVFAEGMGILAEAYAKNFSPAGMLAYDLVTSRFAPADYRAGVRLMLATTKFPTPAALVECCEQAVLARYKAEQEAKDEESRQDYRRRYRQCYGEPDRPTA
jgi:hypothetical protein